MNAVELTKVPKICFKYKHLNSHNVKGALSKLLNSPAMPQKTAYWVGRVGKEIEKALQEISDNYYKMVCEYAEKDSSGVPLKEETNPQAVKIVKGKEKEFEAAYNKFVDNKFEIDFDQLPAKDFERSGLTPNDLMALEPMIYGLE